MAFRTTRLRRRPDCQFSELNTQPTYTPVYASQYTSRCITQNSGPSGSLLLPRRTLSFPTSCRFIPAHRVGLLPTTIHEEPIYGMVCGASCEQWEDGSLSHEAARKRQSPRPALRGQPYSLRL